MMKFRILSIACLLFAASLSAYGQEALKPRLSPLEVVTMKYDETYVKITYGRPHKRDRTVFGNPELVPYGEVWRTGANEATEITLTGPIKIAGNDLKPGVYTVFSIPEKDQWTIILNSDVGQWGAYNYNPEKDVLRFTVPVEPTEVVYEPFTIEFEQQNSGANILMMWDRVKVEIPVEFK